MGINIIWKFEPNKLGSNRTWMKELIKVLILVEKNPPKNSRTYYLIKKNRQCKQPDYMYILKSATIFYCKAKTMSDCRQTHIIIGNARFSILTITNAMFAWLLTAGRQTCATPTLAYILASRNENTCGIKVKRK